MLAGETLGYHMETTSGMSGSFPLVALAVCLSAGAGSPAIETPPSIENQLAPVPAHDLTPGVNTYKATVNAQGHIMSMDITAEIKDGPGVWLATESTQTPLGKAQDQVSIAKGTLLVRERHIRQGPLRVDLNFAGNRAAGEIAMNKSTEAKKINTDLGGPLFADSAGALQSFAALPLADGYKTTFLNFDLQTCRPKLMQLAVTASESVSVPAGSFDAWKLQITAVDLAEKTTVWIAKTRRSAVKYTASMNGASVTAELLPEKSAP